MTQTLYDLLATTQVDDATIAQVDQAVRASYIRPSSGALWSSAVTLLAAIRDSRTYPHGLPIPEQSAVDHIEGVAATVQPTGTQIAEVATISATNTGGVPVTVTATITDGSDSATLWSSSVAAGATAVADIPCCPLLLTATAWLSLSATAPLSFDIAYHLVSV